MQNLDTTLAAPLQQPDQQPTGARRHTSHSQRRDRTPHIPLDTALSASNPLLNHTKHQQNHARNDNRPSNALLASVINTYGSSGMIPPMK